MSLGLAQRPIAGICPISNESIGMELTRLTNTTIGTPTTAVWPTASLAIYVPFRLSVAARLRSLGLYNGSVVSGNLDVGIFRYDGSKVISTGSTVMAGASALQIITVTNTDLSPGRYYLGLSVDNVTASVRRASGASAPMLEAVGVLQEVSFPLPATMTPVAPANAYLPYPFVNFGRLV